MKLILSDRPLSNGLAARADIQYIDLSGLKIANCVGCFGCWTKTPGRCVIRDDATRVYPLIAKSEKIIYCSRVKYGGYDTVMKTMLERAIPVQQAFIRLLDGETHHVQREVLPKDAVIFAYGCNNKDEQDLFCRLVARNAKNMSFSSWDVRFCDENELLGLVESEVEKWAIS